MSESNSEFFPLRKRNPDDAVAILAARVAYLEDCLHRIATEWTAIVTPCDCDNQPNAACSKCEITRLLGNFSK